MKMSFKYLFYFLAFFLLTLFMGNSAEAQTCITCPNGYSSIGNILSSGDKLSVGMSESYKNAIRGRSSGYRSAGIIGITSNHGSTGVVGQSTGSSSTGVVGIGVDSGIFGRSSGYAGFFHGNVSITGTFTQGSDKKLKKDIKPINNALSVIKQLTGKTYQFRTEEYSDLMLPEGNQLGFIAQEVEEVLPEIVEQTSHSVFNYVDGKQEKESKKIEYKAINYIALIPVLTEAIKEQQQIIENQNDKIDKLEERLKNLEYASTFQTKNIQKASSLDNGLLQIRPNPIQEFTNILYTLPNEAEQAFIVISDVQGRKLNQFKLDRTGELTIKGQSYVAGTYLCSLLVDGEVISVSKMQVIK